MLSLKNNSQDILKKIKNSHHKKLPFVVFRQPRSNKVKGYFQNTNELFKVNNFKESGFVFVSFMADEKILFPIDCCEYVETEFRLNKIENVANTNTIVSKNEIERKSHIQLVAKGIHFLKKYHFKKVVLSRKEIVKINNFNLIEVFQMMLNSYENALVYVWYHPSIGLWLGATPELLFSKENRQIKTMALAGTLPYSKGKINWFSKEIKEQQYVTDYIEASLKPLVSKLNVSKPNTVKAGKLVHLKTDISGELLPRKEISDIVKALHPTPAVCGFPLKETRDFIISNEDYSRKFYSGFLGEINKENSSNLYVNLRCMEVLKNEVAIYVGGGITTESVPENEYEETVNKSFTIKNML